MTAVIPKMAALRAVVFSLLKTDIVVKMPPPSPGRRFISMDDVADSVVGVCNELLFGS